MKLLLPLLFATALHAQSFTIPFVGWTQLPQTVEVEGYGDVIFSDLVFAEQLPVIPGVVPVGASLPLTDNRGFRMVEDGEMSVTFMEGPAWDLSALIAGPHGGLIDMVPLDGPEDYPGANTYRFTFTGVDNAALVACEFVPEPSTALLSLFALPLMLRRRR